MNKQKPVGPEGEKGVIINVGSVAAWEAQRGQVAYGASKGAVSGFTLPMARDLGKLGIRVVTVSPGIFETPMGEKMPEKVQTALNKDTPMGRPGRPWEFAHFVQTCIENSYLNGVSLRIDGAIKLGNL